jgi:hypothetical protein
MSYRAIIFAALAAIATVVSGGAQASPIKPFPTAIVTGTGNLTTVYYYRRHYGYYPHPYYHRHYRHY